MTVFVDLKTFLESVQDIIVFQINATQTITGLIVELLDLVDAFIFARKIRQDLYRRLI